MSTKAALRTNRPKVSNVEEFRTARACTVGPEENFPNQSGEHRQRRRSWLGSE